MGIRNLLPILHLSQGQPEKVGSGAIPVVGWFRLPVPTTTHAIFAFITRPMVLELSLLSFSHSSLVWPVCHSTTTLFDLVDSLAWNLNNLLSSSAIFYWFDQLLNCLQSPPLYLNTAAAA